MRVVKRVQCRTLMSCVISRVVALQSGAMSKFCLRIVLFISLSSKTSAFFCPRPVALLARAHCRITDNSHKYPCRTRCIRGAATCRLRAAPTSARTSMGRLSCNIESRVILPAPRRRYIVDNLVWEERSKTTLFAVGADGTGGRNEDRVEVQKNDSDGWRQRVVRTIMTTLSRVRNFLTALSARLGFSRVSYEDSVVRRIRLMFRAPCAIGANCGCGGGGHVLHDGCFAEPGKTVTS